MRPLTDQQKRVLAYFMAYQQDYGTPPTLREASDFLGVSRQRIHQLVKALERKGLMSRSKDPRYRRGWEASLEGKMKC